VLHKTPLNTPSQQHDTIIIIIYLFVLEVHAKQCMQQRSFHLHFTYAHSLNDWTIW